MLVNTEARGRPFQTRLQYQLAHTRPKAGSRCGRGVEGTLLLGYNFHW